jgi:signal transduction histidine kinase
LLETLLAVSLTGVILFRPVYASAAANAPIVDLAYEYLNPAAQQMLQLPARPPETFLTLFPSAATQEGVFAFYRDTFLSGQLGQHQFNYQHDGLDGYFQLAAQRQGSLLLVSFTDTNDQPRTAAEEALRASQAREQTARQEAERQRQHLVNMFEQAPAMICIFDGPQHTFQFVNPPYQALVGSRPLVGLPIAEAMPELAGQPIFGLLDQVYQTGETFYASEMLVQLDHHNESRVQLEQRYYNFIYQARHSLAGAIDGILVFAYEVTPQVLARQQVQDLNEELAAINEELRASNEEYLLANTALSEAQAQLAQLNAELEARVQQRTSQVRLQSHRLERLLADAPAAIATLSGPDLVFEFLNERYQALFPNWQPLGQSVLAALPELAGSALGTVLREVYETGETFEGREVLIQFARPGDGQLEDRYFNFICQARYDLDRRIDGLVLFGFEVTEAVQSRHQREALQAELLAASQQQVQQREDLYQVFAQSPAIVLLLRGPQHRIEYFNAATERLYPGRQLQGRPVSEAMPGAAAHGFAAMLDRVYETGETHTGSELPLTVLNEAGQPVTTFLNFNYQAYREQGQIAGISVFAYDVTEQVLARQARQTQQEEQQRLFAQAPMAITVLRGPQFIIEQANENAEAIWGRTAAEVLGRPHFEAIPDSAGQGFEAMLTGVLESGEAVVLHEVPIELSRVHTGLPSRGYYTIIFKPLRDEHQRVTHIAVMWTESTDQVLARQQVQDLNEELAAINEELTATNEELHRSNARLTRANTDLGTFVYTASHDLKAPISNIEGLVVALRDTLPPAVQQDELVGQLLGLLDDTVHRFLVTIAQLTDLARLQRAYEEPTEVLALAPVVDGVLADLAPAIAEAGADVQVRVPTRLRISFNPASLRSIVYNLLSNALKYRDPARPAQVWLQTEQLPQGVVLTVRDTGLGLTESQQQRLFQVFQRLHTHVEGSGVGLYMIKRLIENAGATIAVTSIPGVGTTFTVTFPI